MGCITSNEPMYEEILNDDIDEEANVQEKVPDQIDRGSSTVQKEPAGFLIPTDAKPDGSVKTPQLPPKFPQHQEDPVKVGSNVEGKSSTGVPREPAQFWTQAGTGSAESTNTPIQETSPEDAKSPGEPDTQEKPVIKSEAAAIPDLLLLDDCPCPEVPGEAAKERLQCCSLQQDDPEIPVDFPALPKQPGNETGKSAEMENSKDDPDLPSFFPDPPVQEQDGQEKDDDACPCQAPEFEPPEGNIENQDEDNPSGTGPAQIWKPNYDPPTPENSDCSCERSA